VQEPMRRTGIEVIGQVPWGTHFCQFYGSRQDLLGVLVPYIRQGLADHEFCMWIASEPLAADEAKAALRAVEPGLDDCLRNGQIEILDHREWYTRTGRFDAGEVLKGWASKLEGALARGYEGLRLTANTFWLEKRDWADFTAYEEAVNRVIGTCRMLALCTYSLDKCGAPEIMDVVSNHRFALVKRDGRWQMIESAERKQAEERLRHQQAEIYTLLENTPAGLVLFEAAPLYKVLAHNRYYQELFAEPFRSKGMVGLSVYEYAPAVEAEGIVAAFEEVVRTRQPKSLLDFPYRSDPPRQRWFNWHLSPLIVDGRVVALLSMSFDVTDRHLTEEALRRHAQELEEFNELMVGRELRMVELKKEINELCRQGGQPPRYEVQGDDDITDDQSFGIEEKGMT
jgi:PAS domain-containing protein